MQANPKSESKSQSSQVFILDKNALRGPLTEHYKDIVDMANHDPYNSGKWIVS